MQIFGQSTRVRLEGAIASSEAAVVAVGGNVALVQNCTVNATQQIEEVTAVGSTDVYWMTGRPQATISVSALVSSQGFWGGWKGRNCGKIGGGSISVSGGRCGFQGSGNVSFSDAVVENLNLDITNGRQTITHGVTVRAGQVSA
jgi:hypothetical protein